MTHYTSSKQQEEEVDLSSNAFNQNPYPVFSKLRENDPVYRTVMADGQYAWIVTRYEDAVSVLKDNRFIKDPTNLITDEEKRTDRKAEKGVFMNTMLFSDLPDHKRLRGLVQKAFTPRMIEGLRGRIEEITNDLLDGIQQEGKMEIINDFAFPLPIIVICEMLGVPSEDRNQFRSWSNTLVEANNNPEQIQNVQQDLEAFIGYIHQLITKRRKDPQRDLISSLIRAEEEGDQLTEPELYGVVSLLIIAGHETTVNLIGNGILALLEHPDQMEKLKQQPNMMKTAVEEFLRYNGPVEFSTNRWAGETLDFKGKTIPKGELVLVALDSADRDPDQFKDPNVLDVTRQQNRHLAFGKGIHFCLGAPLARLEGGIAFNTLLRRMPDLRLNTDPESLQWRPGMLMRGLKELPVAF
ncbi:cytochrome P450 family protein [Lentibacillus jeotgali]|uniref:cytochrome P450 family protein n=1 Tax=Lentibacillus jeotgali TaxID=558169 RepID=UPI0002627CB3|nr:cytochrome P450 [Lentibacillus jeotgali]